MALPTDGHIHSEWSWDAPDGSMELTCARAVDLGLPAVAFTEHADYTTWIVLARDLEVHEHLKAFVTPDGSFVEAHGFRPGHHPYDLWTRPG